MIIKKIKLFICNEKYGESNVIIRLTLYVKMIQDVRESQLTQRNVRESLNSNQFEVICL